MNAFGAWLVPVMPLLVGAVFVLALLVRLFGGQRRLSVREQQAELERSLYQPPDLPFPPDPPAPPPDLSP